MVLFKIWKCINMPYMNILHINEYILSYVMLFKTSHYRGWGKYKVIILLIHKMASLTRGTWVWVNSRSWWWTGRPGVLRFTGSQRVGHDWASELNWTEMNWIPTIRVNFQKTKRYWILYQESVFVNMLQVLLYALMSNTKISYCSSKGILKNNHWNIKKITDFRYFLNQYTSIRKRS